LFTRSIRVRSKTRTKEYETHPEDNSLLFVYTRTLGDEKYLVALNFSGSAVPFSPETDWQSESVGDVELNQWEVRPSRHESGTLGGKNI
jgi:glycosidase